MSAERTCSWCKGPLAPNQRRDAECCSVRCRQARHRYTTAVGSAPAIVDGQPRRLAYADPPYPGRAARYYKGHRDYAGEVDHALLIAQLETFDAWALSTSADALQDVLALCPPGTRVAAWHRGERVNNQATGPLNAWEPVLYAGQYRRYAPANASRPPGEPSPPARGDASRGSPRRVDSIVTPLDEYIVDTSLEFIPSPRTTDPDRVIGAKPATFWRWIFDLLGAQVVDEFVDVFPASGGGARAWETFTRVEVSA